MSLLRSLLIFFIVFGAILVILNINFNPKIKRVIPCDPHELVSLRIQTPSQSVSLDKSPDKSLKTGQWRVQKGSFREIASDKIVDIFNRFVCYLPYVEKFNVDSLPDLEPFNIKNSAYQLTLIGKETTLLSLGKETPSGTEFYLHSSREPQTIYTIANSKKDLLFPAFMELVSREPFSHPAGTLKLAFGEKTWEFVKENNQWKERNDRISPAEANTLIQIMSAFTYENYHGPMTQAETATYGFQSPDVTFQWQLPLEIRSYQMVLFNGRYNLLMNFGQEFYVMILKPNPAEAFLRTLREVP